MQRGNPSCTGGRPLVAVSRSGQDLVGHGGIIDAAVPEACAGCAVLGSAWAGATQMRPRFRGPMHMDDHERMMYHRARKQPARCRYCQGQLRSAKPPVQGTLVSLQLDPHAEPPARSPAPGCRRGRAAPSMSLRSEGAQAAAAHQVAVRAAALPRRLLRGTRPASAQRLAQALSNEEESGFRGGANQEGST